MSLAQIAKLAGVSTATVSRVMNNSDLVSDATASKVRQVADNVGYAFKAGRSRSRGKRERGGRAAARNRRVGVITLGQSHTNWMVMPVIGGFVSGVTAAAREFDVDVMLDEMPNAREMSRLVSRNEIGGAIVLIDSSVMHDREWQQAMANLVNRIPVVWAMGGHTAFIPVDHVLPDNQGVGQLAAEHLANVGCQRVATVTDTPQWPLSRQRVSMFTCAAIDLGLDVVTYLVSNDATAGRAYPGDVQIVQNDAQAVEAISRAGQEIDGLFVPRDVETARLYPLLIKAGLRPQQGMSVVSCDNDLTQLNFLHPRPVSIDLNTQEVARIAIRRLRLRMRNQSERPVVVNVQPTLALPDNQEAAV